MALMWCGVLSRLESTMARNGTKEALVADLTSKYAEKPWNETLQLVRRCMSKMRDPTSSSALSGCLQRLQEALNVSSMNAMVSRLEVIARQRGLGSHLSPTETACYLTADLFYLEVLLKPDGGVEDVKVALHGEAPVMNYVKNPTRQLLRFPNSSGHSISDLKSLSMGAISDDCASGGAASDMSESSELLLQLLRQKKFEDFSTKLNDLSSLYNIPGDNDTKMKVCTALQFIEKDLLTISHMPRPLIENDVYIDTVLNGSVGKMIPSGAGAPLKIQYYISPSNILLRRHYGDVDDLTQDAFVMLGSRESPHQLQLASLIPSPPQIDAQGSLLFSALTEVASESLPACFILKLHTPLALCSSVIHRMEKITDVKPEADQQWEPLCQLLMRTALGEKWVQESSYRDEEASFLVTLPGAQVHEYVLPGPVWSGGCWEGALIDTIPFTHPAHVPLLLQLLRHQSALNTLLVSCIKDHKHQPGGSSHLYCEVLPESDFSFTITFLLPGTSSLAVLLVTVMESRQVCCQLSAPKLMDTALNDYISRVMTRCMSIPITMRAVHKSLSHLIGTNPSGTSTDTEISTSPHKVNMQPAPDLHTGLSKMEKPGSPEMISQTAPPHPAQSSSQEEDAAMYPSPSCYVMSVSSTPEANDANTAAAANPYPLSSTVCVFPHWPANGHVAAELV